MGAVEDDDFRRRRLRTDLSAPPPGLDVCAGVGEGEADNLGVEAFNADLRTLLVLGVVVRFGVVQRSSPA